MNAFRRIYGFDAWSGIIGNLKSCLFPYLSEAAPCATKASGLSQSIGQRFRVRDFPGIGRKKCLFALKKAYSGGTNFGLIFAANLKPGNIVNKLTRKFNHSLIFSTNAADEIRYGGIAVFGCFGDNIPAVCRFDRGTALTESLDRFSV